MQDLSTPDAVHPIGAPDLRLHLVTLGVADLARASAFYEAMGLQRRAVSSETVAFFQCGHVLLSLYPRHLLAEDATLPDDARQTFSGLALACNVAAEGEVAALIARAVDAGGQEVKPAQKVFWGGTSGYFADPDGHMWEVAHNPFFPFDAEGRLTVPVPGAA
ncbi:VOC family protein [Xanthobacter sp. KR7-65]|uniref:VOC family protein n=1 Tax=Xanthobacter sp. KR7-65 TaxID=3156612 RepID=UPI0032B3572E